MTRDQIPTASVADTVRTVATVLLPVAARGAVLRRPVSVRLAQWADADRRGVRQVQRLRRRYGPGPVQLRLPFRRVTLLLEPDQVHRVLAQSPVPFALDTREKRAALGHFQPAGLLVSSPAERALRRPFNEQVLDAGLPLHRLAEPMSVAVREEASLLLARVERRGVLAWDDFAVVWWRVVRRVVLGDSARDDELVTDQLQRLRRRANLSYLGRQRPVLRADFLSRLAGYVERAEPGSLASLVASTPAPPGTDPVQQVPQWLFAFDAAAWAGVRALALLSAHPAAVASAREESHQAPDLPFLRSCVLESLRLWPTTPAILRDTTQETSWSTGRLPAGAAVLLYAPFFHRDETRVAQAHRFAPELWQRPRDEQDWPLVPFSGGPGTCPGRDVVLLTVSTMLSTLLEQHDPHVVRGAELSSTEPLPGTLSPFALRFQLVRRLEGGPRSPGRSARLLRSHAPA